MNVYYDPEKFDLSPVGDIDFSSGSYEFDMTVVWRRGSDGLFFYADDSGCSCPAPFESVGINDLTLAESLAALQSHLESRNQPEYGYDRSGEIVDLLGRAREAGLR